MDLLTMQQFKIIAEQSSVSEAAKILYVSQPALSKKLSRLEAELGCRLFDRNKNKLVLNENGSIALKYVNDILSHVNLFQAEFNRRQSASEGAVLRFLSSSPVLAYLIPYFLNNYSNIRCTVEISSDPIGMNKLLEYTDDILLSTDNLSLKTDVAISIPLIEDSLCVSVPNTLELSKRSAIKIEDLAGYSFLRSTTKNSGYLSLLASELIKEAGITIKTVYDVDRTLLPVLAENTENIMFASSLARFQPTTQYSKNRTLVKIDHPRATNMMYINYLKDNYDKIRLFLEWLETHKNILFE